MTAADASEAPAGRMDAAALDRIAIRVSPRVFGNRIRCVREDADVAKEVRVPPDQVKGSWSHSGKPCVGSDAPVLGAFCFLIPMLSCASQC